MKGMKRRVMRKYKAPLRRWLCCLWPLAGFRGVRRPAIPEVLAAHGRRRPCSGCELVRNPHVFVPAWAWGLTTSSIRCDPSFFFGQLLRQQLGRRKMQKRSNWTRYLGRTQPFDPGSLYTAHALESDPKRCGKASKGSPRRRPCPKATNNAPKKQYGKGLHEARETIRQKKKAQHAYPTA